MMEKGQNDYLQRFSGSGSGSCMMERGKDYVQRSRESGSGEYADQDPGYWIQERTISNALLDQD